MNNLCFHITDITSNSVRAGATEIKIFIEISRDTVTIRISDNGCGMDAATLARVTDPFFTSRSRRKVGLGLSFLRQNAEQTGGSLHITSGEGNGTLVEARFIQSHIDCPPMGDLPETMALLITGNPDINIVFSYSCRNTLFSISSNELKEALDGMPLSHPQVTVWIKEMISHSVS